MAAGDAYVQCANPHIGLVELLNSVLVKHDNGSVGIRTFTQTVATGSLNDFLSCGEPLKDVEAILRHIICLDNCGRPSIRLVTCTP